MSHKAKARISSIVNEATWGDTVYRLPTLLANRAKGILKDPSRWYVDSKRFYGRHVKLEDAPLERDRFGNIFVSDTGELVYDASTHRWSRDVVATVYYRKG